MTASAKVSELSGRISAELSALVDRDYYLLECPYYGNIGDTLIWQGEMDFLKSVSYECKGMHGIQTLPIDALQQTNLILFQGGGNFGDLWPEHQRMKFRVMERYPDYRYIFLPVSVCYESAANLQNDIDFLSKYDALLCARDGQSYQFLQEHFHNPVLLVPDMAFCADLRKYRCRKQTDKNLLIMRTDKEFKSHSLLNDILQSEDVEVMDWPTFRFDDPYFLMMNRLLYRTNNRITDWYCRTIYKRHLIQTGVDIIASHRMVYSTRLHAAILSVLLGKDDVRLFDNSYGKNGSVYNTWLSDCDSIKLIQ